VAAAGVVVEVLGLVGGTVAAVVAVVSGMVVDVAAGDPSVQPDAGMATTHTISISTHGATRVAILLTGSSPPYAAVPAMAYPPRTGGMALFEPLVIGVHNHLLNGRKPRIGQSQHLEHELPGLHPLRI